MEKKITIKEIAQLAGVSIGTVDRVLHDRGDVESKKKELILEICRANNYAQNIVGRAMAMQKRAKRIAVVINASDRNAFSETIHKGVEKIASEINDYNITFAYHDIVEDTVSEMVEILKNLDGDEIAGLIIKPKQDKAIKNYIEKLIERNVKVVFCTSDMTDVNKLCYIGQNHYKDGRLVGNTLLKVFHEQLKILIVVGRMTTISRQIRLDGFRDYLEENKREYEIYDIKETGSDKKEIKAVLLEALEQYPDTNAIYLNPVEVEPCLQAIEDFGDFTGVCFAFGMKTLLASHIQSGMLDFIINENPFIHGYRSGEALFRYFLNNELPDEEKCLANGDIIFEENCID